MEWHDEARRLHALGYSQGAIGKAVGRSQTTVREFLMPEAAAARLEAKKRRRDRERASYVGARVRIKTDPCDRNVVRAYADKPAPAQPEITLPAISLPALPVEMDAKPQIRLAPTVRLTVNAGADRIRAIHRSMIRRGLIAERGLVEEFAR